MSRKVGTYQGGSTQIAGREASWFTSGSTRLPPSDAKGLPPVTPEREGKLLRPVGDVDEPPRLIKGNAKRKSKRKRDR